MPTRTWRGTLDSNWGTLTNWLELAVPTSADDVVFDSSSPACTINSSARTAKTIDFSGYTNTITFSQTLTVSGNIILGASMSFAGTSALICNETATLTSNGKTCSVPLTLATTNKTYTLGDNWTVSGLCTLGANTACTLNSNNLYVTGNLTINSNGGISGTTTINYTGTGIWTGATNAAIKTNFIINTAGTLTLSANVAFGASTLTYTAGTVVTTGSTLTLVSSCTLDTSGITWNNISQSAAITVTLSSKLVVTGTTTLGTNTLTINSNIWYISGILSMTQTTGNISGSSLIIFNGPTTISESFTTGALKNNVILSGSVVFPTTLHYNTGILTYLTGSITSSGRQIQSISSTTFAILSPGLSLGTIITSGSLTFSGSQGVTIDSIQSTTTNLTHSFYSGSTYIISSNLTMLGTGTTYTQVISSTAGSFTNLYLNAAATQDIGFIEAKDINSYPGQPIYNFKGIMSNTINWIMLSPTYTSAYVF